MSEILPFSSTAGGVMTIEVGAISGDLWLRLDPASDGLLEARVTYAEADEWYTVAGGPLALPISEPSIALARRVVEHLTARSTTVEGANPEPLDLNCFHP